jgi:hypothetical protein
VELRLLNLSDTASALRRLFAGLIPIEKLRLTFSTSKNGKFLSADLDINRFKDANLPVSR